MCAAVLWAAGGDVFAVEEGVKCLGKVQVREGAFDKGEVWEKVGAEMYALRSSLKGEKK